MKRQANKEESGPRGTIATRVYERLRRDILSGGLPPGEKLRTEYLRTRYEVGNTPLREALNRLSADGLVARIDQRGFSVSGLSRNEFEDLLKTRCWLEEVALRESIRKRTQEWEENVVLALHRLSREPTLLEGESNPAWEKYHHRFHLSLLANCGSAWLMSFCVQLLDQTDRYRQLASAASYGDRDLMKEHRSVFEATIEGDADRAVELLTAHYHRTGKIILQSQLH